MSRKKNVWISYGRNADMIEILIRDSTGAKIESFKFNGSNKKFYSQAIQQIKEKYGWSPEVDVNVKWFKDQ